MTIDVNTILQIDSTVIAGMLILLTLLNTGGEFETFVTDFYTLILGAIVIGLFAFSAMSTTVSKKTETERRIFNPESYMLMGFIFLMLFIPLIVGTTIYQRVSSESPAMLCAKNLTAFNLTHLSECGKFTPGSIAEDCAQRPARYNLELGQCSELAVK